jgi:hypothetical protein
LLSKVERPRGGVNTTCVGLSQLSGLSIGPAEGQNPGSRGLFVGDSPFQGETEEKRDHRKSPILQGLSEVARVGIEPTTPRFSASKKKEKKDKKDPPWMPGLS